MAPDLTEFVPFFFYGGLDSPIGFGLGLLISTAFDLLVAECLVFGPPPRRSRPGPVGLPRVLSSVAVLALLFLAKGWAAARFIGGFGMISILWYDLLIVAPWCSVRVLHMARRGRVVSRSVYGVAVGSLAFLPVAAWARFVEPFRLQVERVHVSDERAAGAPRGPEEPAHRPLRIAVLADIQTDRISDYEREVAERALAIDPDLILIPGDLYQGTPGGLARELDAYRSLLAGLEAPGGVYFVQGDVDPPAYVEALLQGTGVRWLRDEVVRVEVAGRAVWVAGLSRGLSDRSRRAVRELEAAPSPALKLVVCHYARAVNLLATGSDVDLVVGGHTHGGQVVLPFYGPPMTLSPLPRAVGAGGLHQVGEHRVYVSRGIGMERMFAPRIRFLCPPELTLLLFDPPVD